MANTNFYPANGLEINFLGLPLVFNDGQTENTLKLALTNNNFSGLKSGDQDNSITFTPDTPIYIWFVVDDRQAAAEAERSWALTSYDAFHDGKVQLTPDIGNWDVERSDDLTGNPLNDSLHGWKLTPKAALNLTPGQSLVLTLSGLTTALPDGHTSCYCQVDMPVLDAYGDEAESLLKVIGPMTKSRLMIVGDKVGIGTASPGAALEVDGAVRARGGDPGDYGSGNSGFMFDGRGDADSGMTSLEDGELAFYANNVEAIRIQEHDASTDGTSDRQIEATVFGDLHISVVAQGVSGGNLELSGQLTAGGGAKIGGDLQAGGILTTTGAAGIGGDIQSQGRIEDKFGAVMPVGSIIAYGGSTPPPGWLLCDGQEVQQEQYPDLYAVLGGEMAGAMHFDGSNYLDVASLHTPGTLFSISMHIFPETLNDWQVLCQFSDDESLESWPNFLVLQIYQSKLRVAINSVTGGGQIGGLVALANTPLKAQQWNHLIVSTMEGVLRIYLDGSKQDFSQLTVNNVAMTDFRFAYALGPNCNFSRIGAGGKGAGSPFVGKIKNLRFPSSPLNDDDITKLSQSSALCTTPDLRGRFIVVAGQGPGRFSYVNNATGGEETHVLTVSEMPTHVHSYSQFDLKDTDWKGGGDSSAGNGTGDNTPAISAGEGGNQPHNNLPPYYALTYIIKC